MNKRCLKDAFRVTVPVLLGYITCGIAFGLVLTDAGYPWWLASCMSVFMFAGAAQFAAVPLFAAHTPLAVILVTEALLNIRHIVYGLPLIKQFKQCGRRRPYLIFALTDETFSLLTTVPVPEGTAIPEFYSTVAVLDHLYWIAGSTLGAVAGVLIPFDLTGVDFALTALFAVLTVDQFTKFLHRKGGAE